MGRKKMFPGETPAQAKARSRAKIRKDKGEEAFLKMQAAESKKARDNRTTGQLDTARESGKVRAQRFRDYKKEVARCAALGLPPPTPPKEKLARQRAAARAGTGRPPPVAPVTTPPAAAPVDTPAPATGPLRVALFSTRSKGRGKSSAKTASTTPGQTPSSRSARARRRVFVSDSDSDQEEREERELAQRLVECSRLQGAVSGQAGPDTTAAPAEAVPEESSEGRSGDGVSTVRVGSFYRRPQQGQGRSVKDAVRISSQESEEVVPAGSTPGAPLLLSSEDEQPTRSRGQKRAATPGPSEVPSGESKRPRRAVTTSRTPAPSGLRRPKRKAKVPEGGEGMPKQLQSEDQYMHDLNPTRTSSVISSSSPSSSPCHIHQTPSSLPTTPQKASTPKVNTSCTPRKNRLRYQLKLEKKAKLESTQLATAMAKANQKLKKEAAQLRDLLTDTLSHRTLNDKVLDGRAAANRKRKTVTDASVIELVSKGLHRLPERVRNKVLRMLLPETPVLKKMRVASSVARLSGCHRKSVTFKLPTVKTPAERHREERRRRVVEFLTDPQNGTTLPGKKDTMYSLFDRKKHQIVQLTDYLYVLVALYNDANPGFKCSLTTFQKIRQRHPWIRPLLCSSNEICLCIRHQNFTLRLRAAGVKQLADRVVTEHTEEQFADILNTNITSDSVTCSTWCNVKVPIGNPVEKKTVIKLRLVASATDRASFIKSLKAEFVTLREHTERARTQHRVVRELRQNMSDEEVTVQMDFAENWLINYNKSPQQVYYNKEPVTLHPVCIHYKDVETGEVKVHSLALTTDDRKHDAGAILAFMRVITDFIKTNLPHVRVVHYVSDAPSSQYRNISIFSVLCQHKALFGLIATWTYFEAGHGKGPCDGIGAWAKRSADDAVKKGNLIVDAADFARRGNAARSKVLYICIPVKDIELARRTLKSIVAVEHVKGTQMVHAAVTVAEKQSIAVRGTSCFTDCCWEDCVSHRRCPGWSVHQLDFKRDIIPQAWFNATVRYSGPLDVAPEEEPEPTACADIASRVEVAAPRVNNLNQREEYAVGDYVACVFDADWYLAKVLTSDSPHYELEFMERRAGTNSFTWPTTKDLLWVESDDILGATTPIAHGSSRRTTSMSLPLCAFQAINIQFDSM